MAVLLGPVSQPQLNMAKKIVEAVKKAVKKEKAEPKKCEDCNGRGLETPFTLCQTCHGSGTV